MLLSLSKLSYSRDKRKRGLLAPINKRATMAGTRKKKTEKGKIKQKAKLAPS